MDMEGVPRGTRPAEQGGAPKAADTAERWLVTKGSLDYGPYSTADLVEQIRGDQVVPGHIIIDNDTGERHFAEHHPQFGLLVEQARQTRDDNRRANAELAHTKTSKRRGLMLVGFIAAGVGVMGLVVYLLIGKRGQDTETAAPQGVSAFGAGKLEAKIGKISVPAPTKPKPGSKPGGRRTGPGSDTMELDMGQEGGGSEQVSGDAINAAIRTHSKGLGQCLGSNGGGYAKIQFNIDGPTGRVTSVQVNGQQSGGLYSCVNRVMRSMKFPAVDGPRTRAEFDMEL